jgi:hypothetical protein
MTNEWREVCRTDRIPTAHDVRVLLDGHRVLVRALDDGGTRVLSTDGSTVEQRVVDGILQLRLVPALPEAG